MSNLRTIVKGLPLVGPLSLKVFHLLNPKVFPGSAEYWESRYATGDNSGSGSYSHLAHFKADFINDFVKKNQIKDVIEFGVGDGNQLTLAEYPTYIGLDVARTAIMMCMEKFKGDKTKSFYMYDSRAYQDNHGIFKAELAMSLDVLFHLIEDDVFGNYLKHLFQASNKYVIVFSSNFEKEQTFHEKDRVFAKWVEQNITGFDLLEIVKNAYPYDKNDPDNTSKADFFIYRKKGA